MSRAEDAVAAYLATIRTVRSTGIGTAEQSYYPAIRDLLSRLGSLTSPARKSLTHPAGVERGFPDIALYEQASNVLVLPVEVKPASTALQDLLSSAQAYRYAQAFGGGTVLVTNLRAFAIGRVDGTQTLRGSKEITLATSEVALGAELKVEPHVATDLLSLIEDGCQVRGAIASPALVARLLAYHARQMRDAINDTRNVDSLLAPISAALRDGLQIELPATLLVPTVVQTLVYGLFAAWMESDEHGEFNWMDTAYRLKVPVFADVLHASLRPHLVRASHLTRHLEAIARVLAWVDRETFTREFDGDAIQYFYEPFLAEFDPELRRKLGVWYTPREIAEYQVARADFHLKHDLGITGGIAESAVYLLDPACGTGTYIAAILRHIYQANIDNGECAAVAAARAYAAATQRVLGFELLPAAFIICHLNIIRLLQRLGGTPQREERIRVYLTNALTGWDAIDTPSGETLFPELEEELLNAAAVKHTEPVLVVLGNPPYEGYSTAETAEERRMLAPWAVPLRSEWGLTKHRLNDLYVRFWRVALERIVQLTGRGVISFITNRKWLTGRSYPAMREDIVTSFQIIRVDDLHGAVDDATHPGDQSIFSTTVAAGIKRGTAIVTTVRIGPLQNGQVADVLIHDYWGSAAEKRTELTTADHDNSRHYQSVPLSRETWWRLTPSLAGEEAPVDHYLPFFLSGVQPVRDDAVLAFEEQLLRKRMQTYFNPEINFEQVVARHPGFGVERARYNAKATRHRLLASSSYLPQRVVRVLYRPFDVRWLYWQPDSKLLNEPRAELIPYWENVPRQRCLVLPRTPRRTGALRPVVSCAIAYNEAAEPNARLFPLYRPQTLTDGQAADEYDLEIPTQAAGELELEIPRQATRRRGPKISTRKTCTYLGGTMVAPDWILATKAALGLSDDTAAGEIVFFSLIAVMHSPVWLSRQPVELDDFPEVPVPGEGRALVHAAEVGRQIADLTDPIVPVHGVTTGRIDALVAGLGIPDFATGTVTLEYGTKGRRGGRRRGADVLWSGESGWRNVPDEVWAYTACGFPVLPKWLSYRVSTGLTTGDREHFMFTVRRIAVLLRLQVSCDEAYMAAVEQPLAVSASGIPLVDTTMGMRRRQGPAVSDAGGKLGRSV